MLISVSCTLPSGNKADKTIQNQLAGDLQLLADSVNGDVGIAFFSDDGDTILINNDRRYPLMSVFKLHQSIATLRNFEESGCPLDSIVSINRNDLNQSTWSPMLKDYNDDSISISYRDLIRYALTLSDNNASNYLFQNIIDVKSADSTISKIIPREEFEISYSEEEMQRQLSRAFDNYSSPYGAALLIEKIYKDSTLLSGDHSDFIRACLEECKTGTDRIMQPLREKPGIKIGHKTGSGYRDNGILIAHNDVAFIKLPGNRSYVLAVFIKNFRGSEEEASKIIARVSSIVYHAISDNSAGQ